MRERRGFRRVIAGLAILTAGIAPAADEFAIAYRVRGDDSTGIFAEANWNSDTVAYGLKLWKGGMFGSSPYYFEANSVEGVMGSREYLVFVETETNPGAWHHVVFTYSRTNRLARLTFDGVSQRSWRLGEDERLDEARFLKKPEKGFGGEIAGLKVFRDRIPDVRELFAGDVPAEHVAASKAAFEKAAAEPGVTPAFAAWCRAKAKAAAAFGKGSDLGAWHRLETLRLRLPRLLPLAKTKVDGDFLPFAIDRYAPDKHLPYAVPKDAKTLLTAEIDGAKGEWDCDSFMLHPLADAKDFFLKPTDLKGPDGAVIPADAIDIRVVTCWYQCGNAYTTWIPRGRGIPLLCPEVLVHDDALLRIDTANRVNYLRLSYPDGEQYVDISKPEKIDLMTPFNVNREPVFDAKSFRPLDLREGEMRQFWLTLKVPEDRTPGDYAGALEMSVGGKVCGTIPLKVRIYPFRLPWPSPHYDIDRPMLNNYLAHANLRDFLNGCHPYIIGGGYPHWGAAIRRRDAIVRNLVDHGFGNVDVESYGSPTNEWDFSDADAAILKRNGAVLDPILGNIGIVTEFMQWIKYPPKGKKDLSIEGNLDFWRETMRDVSNKFVCAEAKLREQYGHSRTVCGGFDEAGAEGVRREMPYFATVNHFGSRTYTSRGSAEASAFITDWDCCPFAFDRKASRTWHSGGCVLTTYAHPHGGAECPDIWRRQKGLVLYFADMDGQREYILFEGPNLWNEFIADAEYRNFNMIQPTFDGALDTIQWEANREGIDDQRYATLLKRACRAARRSGDAALVKAGRENDVWLELSDYKSGDLDALRREMAARIAALLKQLAAKGIDVEKLSPPLPVRQNLPLPEPYRLSAEGYAKRNMLDLAAVAWEREGTEKALFKAVAAHVDLGEIPAAEKVLRRIEEDPQVTPQGKALAELKRATLGLVKTKFVWTPSAADLEKAREALDKAIRRGRSRLDIVDVGIAADQLMRGYAAVGERKKAIEVGEKLVEPPLRKALSSDGPVRHVATHRFIGEQYAALKEYKRAMEWFEKCGLDVQALVSYAEAAEALGDYPRAMTAYTRATKLYDPAESQGKIDALNRKAAAISKALRQYEQKSGRDAASGVDETPDPISLDE